MSDENGKDRIIPWTALILVASAIGVVFFNRTPLEWTRPEGPKVSQQYEKIPARLWQDPFLAVLQKKEAKMPPPAGLIDLCGGGFKVAGGSTANPGGLAGELLNKIEVKQENKDNKGRVTVVGVMVFGGLNAEEEELRIRHRYATLSAFHRLGFIPVDTEHVDYLGIAEGTSPDKVAMNNIMPYEWLKRDDNDKDEILLLWVNDENFKSSPLDKLDRLQEALGLRNRNVPFRIIGPAGSTTLSEMYANARKLGRNGPVQERYSTAAKETSGSRDRKTPIEIFSATATIDDSMLLQQAGAPDARNPTRNVEVTFKDSGFPLKRTTCSDRVLAGGIFNELLLRGIDCKDSSNHIVVISEWDSLYGRSLPEIYKRVFFAHDVINIDRQLHVFSYVRGIDGKTDIENKDEGAGAGKDENNDNSGKEKATNTLEQASGKSQFDYIRRLADEIYRFEQQLDNGGSIRAIGVLGLDFHDKYLVLQAMRQRFPKAVIFTTDLDARYLHPQALQWTHNIVVAASYNFGLRSDHDINLQGEGPPFRDSSQTSIFFAILKAFARDDGYLTPDLQDVVLQDPQPKIFEIGRYRAVDLSEDPDKARTFDPRQQEKERSTRILKKGAFLLILTLVLLALCSERVRTCIRALFCFRGNADETVKGKRDNADNKSVEAANEAARRAAKKTGLALGGVLLTVLLVIGFYRGIVLRPHLEEPFSLMDGVSIWPTEMLRLLSAGLSVFFIRQSRIKVGKIAADIAKEFGFDAARKRALAIDGAPGIPREKTGMMEDAAQVFRKFSEVVRYDWGVKAADEEERVDDYWNEYRRRDSAEFRIRRLAPIVVSYMALCGLIISFDSPISPVRGVLSMISDRVLLILSTVVFIFLVFYTFDVIRTCRRFLELLVEKDPPWSPHSFSLLFNGHSEDAKPILKEWMLIHLTARITAAVGPLIFFPFVVWVIMLASRLKLIDNWYTPITLVIVISLSAVYTWSCAYVLRRSAERARETSLGRLVRLKAQAYAKPCADSEELKRLDFTTNAVSSIQEGAFAPFTKNPVIQALLVPFGGVGGVLLTKFLSSLGI